MPARVREVPVPGAVGEPAVGNGMVTLTWADPEDDAITVYQVSHWESDVALPPAWRDIPDSGQNTTGHVVESLTNGIEYTFEVRAVAGAYPGDSSRVKAVPVPGAPVWAGDPVVGDGAVTLAWDDPDDADIARYEFRYRANGAWDPDWTAIDPSGPNTTGHTVGNLTNGIEYTIEVRALRVIIPGFVQRYGERPGNLTAREDDRAVTLTWDNLDTPDVTGYEIRYGVGEAPAAWTVISVSPVSDASTTTHPVPGLTNGIKYTIRGARDEGVR